VHARHSFQHTVYLTWWRYFKCASCLSNGCDAMAAFPPLNLKCLCLDAQQLSSLQAHLAVAKNRPRATKSSKRSGVAKNCLASAANKKQKANASSGAPINSMAVESCSERAPRRENSASGCPSLSVILKRFCNAHPYHGKYVGLFDSMLRYEGSYDENYSPMDVVPSYSQFLSYFMIRKVMSSAKGKKKAAAAMSALLRYCIANNYMSGAEAEAEVRRVDEIGSFDGDALGESIQLLYDTGYWDQLRRQTGGDANIAGNDDDENEGGASDEGGMIITEVRKDGWMMARDIARWTGDVHPDDPDKFFVQLPPDVAARGRVDVRFSCMALVLRRGVWSPEGMYDEEYVCANVYPPSGF